MCASKKSGVKYRQDSPSSRTLSASSQDFQRLKWPPGDAETSIIWQEAGNIFKYLRSHSDQIKNNFYDDLDSEISRPFRGLQC